MSANHMTQTHKPRLYELVGLIADVYAILDDNGGELDLELAETLDTLDDELERKVENICKLIRNLEAEDEFYSAQAEIFAKEAKRLASKAHAKSNAVERLKRYLKTNLEHLDRTKVEAGTFTVTIQANGGKPAVKWLGAPGEIPLLLRKECPPELDREKALRLVASVADDARAHALTSEELSTHAIAVKYLNIERGTSLRIR